MHGANMNLAKKALFASFVLFLSQSANADDSRFSPEAEKRAASIRGAALEEVALLAESH